MAKSKSKKVHSSALGNSEVAAGAGLLFAGICTVAFGGMQQHDAVELFLVGFGAALLVVGAVILGLAVNAK